MMNQEKRTRIFISTEDSNPSFKVDDRVFLGEGLFETLKVDAFEPCHAPLHWQRLSTAAQRLEIPFDVSLAQWEESLRAQIRQKQLRNGGIKAILSSGSGPRGLTEHGEVSQLTFQAFTYEVQSQPLKLARAQWVRDVNNPIYQVKSINYLEAICARKAAIQQAADDVLFFNQLGHATETTCANLFIIQNNQILTPPLTDGVLAGITRGRILARCEQLNIACVEQSINTTMLNNAEGVFVTNALQGIRSVLSFEENYFATEHPLMQKVVS